MKNYQVSKIIEADNLQSAMDELRSNLDWGGMPDAADVLKAGWKIEELPDYAGMAWDRRRHRAVELMTHYFEMAFRNSGAQWTGDNVGEIETLVESLMEPRPKEVD